MTALKKYLASKSNRVYLYTVEVAVLAVLLGYGIIDADKIPLWLVLGASLLGITQGTVSIANVGSSPNNVPPTVDSQP